MSPLSNAYVETKNLLTVEQFYPLHAFVCDQCFLVQLGEFESPENIFSDYAYFSSYSESWLRHAAEYADMIQERLKLDRSSRVIEIASNDGYLLRNFVRKGIPALGFEPAANVAAAAEKNGVRTIVEFFSQRTAEEIVERGDQADLIVANNVLAHVPAVNDFVAGLAVALKRFGTITLEFPHLLRLMEENQFDTIYHEHFSYFSLGTVRRIAEKAGLEVCDVERLSTHGGSLRVYLQHIGVGSVRDRVDELIAREEAYGLTDLKRYTEFEGRVRSTKRALLRFFLEAKDRGETVVGYGAAAKGNTLLNYCGIREDLLDYVVDRSSFKQGRYLPGTHIPISAPERVFETRPDWILILPWNLRHEIAEQMRGVREWGGRFVVPIPQVTEFT